MTLIKALEAFSEISKYMLKIAQYIVVSHEK